MSTLMTSRLTLSIKPSYLEHALVSRISWKTNKNAISRWLQNAATQERDVSYVEIEIVTFGMQWGVHWAVIVEIGIYPNMK